MTTIEDAAAALAKGGVVVFPTETVYGIGCRLDRPEAVLRVAQVKRRPPENPFQVLVATPGDVASIGELGADAREVVRRHMPGPLTLVVRAVVPLPPGVGRDGTVGVRVPAHPVAAALIRLTGPMAASSANRTGRPTPDRLEEVREDLGDEVDAYVDGPSPEGLASTVLDLSGPAPRLLREGAVGREALAAILKSPIL